jgi:hypothetical protein
MKFKIWVENISSIQLAEVEEEGIVFKTGVPVTFTYARNNQKAPKPSFDDPFQQKIEPAGRYMVFAGSRVLAHLETGKMTFRNPLVIPENSGTLDKIYDENSWKMNVSNQYASKGVKLSKILVKQGFDGIVTVKNYKGKNYTGEIVDLTGFHTSP